MHEIQISLVSDITKKYSPESLLYTQYHRLNTLIIFFNAGNKQLHEVPLYHARSINKETEVPSKMSPWLHSELFQTRVWVVPKSMLPCISGRGSLPMDLLRSLNFILEANIQIYPSKNKTHSQSESVGWRYSCHYSLPPGQSPLHVVSKESTYQ